MEGILFYLKSDEKVLKQKKKYEKLPNNESFIDINDIFDSNSTVPCPPFTDTALESNTLEREKTNQ